MHSLRCEICGAFLVLNAQTVEDCYENSWYQLHKEWHDKIDVRINAAAEVGAKSDVLNTLMA